MKVLVDALRESDLDPQDYVPDQRYEPNSARTAGHQVVSQVESRNGVSSTDTPGMLCLTSFKKTDAMTSEIIPYTLVATHGRKYGYCFQNGLLKSSGHRSCGRESNPPASGLSRCN